MHIHQIHATSDAWGFTAPVNPHNQNRAAHGNIGVTETCLCGAERKRLINGRHEELGEWTGGMIQTPPEEHRLERDGDRDVSFTGWEIGEGRIGERGKSLHDSSRGTTVMIYLTEGGRYLAHVVQWSAWEGDSLRRVLGPADDGEELLALLVEDAGGELGRASKEAWEAACAAWPDLGEHETERID